jgi:hypothetical protein
MAVPERVNLCPGCRGRLSALSVFLCKSILYGAFVWVRRALKHQKRRFPARAVRVQALRGVGGNGWRMSHNPYRDTLYDTMDRLGVLVWDETRDLRAPQLPAFKQMVRQHRNHPSIMVWSFCNEGGCGSGSNHSLASAFRDIAYTYDGSRKVSGNMRKTVGPGTLSDILDVQGLSHPAGADMDAVHGLPSEASKALIASECCSCMTMRGENHRNTSKSRPVPSNFNADCLSQQVNRSDDGRPWAVGSMVWTLFGAAGNGPVFVPLPSLPFRFNCRVLSDMGTLPSDYFGEPYGHAWPHVASSYGSFDVAGFPKAAVWWYRALWLGGIEAEAPDRPPLRQQHTIRIVQDNERASRAPDPESGAPANVIQVYSSCPTVELLVNGASLGKQAVARYMWAEYSFPYTAGNLTAVGHTAAGAAVATHTVQTAAEATKVVVSVDVPSIATGTGSALLLDGQDVGLVRAEVVDALGRIVPSAAHNVTFTVVSGPGRVIGVGNGDPTNHQPNTVVRLLTALLFISSRFNCRSCLYISQSGKIPSGMARCIPRSGSGADQSHDQRRRTGP